MTKGIQAHHIAPFHFCVLVGRPDLELDIWRNIINLSESEKGLAEVNYHLLIGHSDDFQSSNLSVREDARAFYGLSAAEITTNTLWQERVKGRCKPWAQWTDPEKATFRAWLDREYPLPEGVTPEQQVQLLVARVTEESSHGKGGPGAHALHDGAA